jgi:hypothetical protein
MATGTMANIPKKVRNISEALMQLLYLLNQSNPDGKRKD